MAEYKLNAALGGSSSDTYSNREKYELELIKKNLSIHKKYLQDKDKLDRDAEKLLEKRLFDSHKKTIKEKLEADKKYYKDQLALATTFGEKLKGVFGVAGASLMQAVNSAGATMDKYAGIYSQYMSGINARLQGTSNTFSSLMGTIRGNTALSPYVKQTAVLQNLSNLVDKGIAYNIEQRAFLATISDKIATTFDVANGTLLRLIRIQQADSTAARLGMEASLTTFLNRNFSDTSYLTNSSDAISSLLLGASSQLGRNESLAFEYQAQKWLGSLSSVGVSDTALQSIAQGLNYLGTGDIAELSSNPSLQRLLVMASGGGYGSLLQGGLSAANTNDLFKNIVSIAQGIGNISNNVVRQQYAGLYGFDLADITAIMNLTSEDLVKISSNMLTYSDAINETTKQLSQVGSRMHISEQIDNLLENMLATVGGGMADNPISYLLYKGADFIEKNFDTAISSSVVGSGVNPLGVFAQGAKLGSVGWGLISQIPAVINALSNGGALNLSNWNGIEYLRQGQGFTGIRTTPGGTVSQISYIGNASNDAIYESSLLSAKEQRETITGQEVNSVDAILTILTAWRDSGITLNTSGQKITIGG